MTLGDRIRQLRENKEMTQLDLAKILKVSDKTVSTWENDLKIPRMGTIEKIADYFGVTKADIVDNENAQPTAEVGQPYNPSHRIPILGRISAGLPLYAEQNIEGYTYTDLNGSGEYFALIVKGDSMNAMRICDGDIAIIRKQEIVEDGDIAVIMIGNDEATIKRFYHNDNMVTLMPQSTNPIHQPQIYDINQINIKVIGKLKKVEILY